MADFGPAQGAVFVVWSADYGEFFGFEVLEVGWAGSFSLGWGDVDLPIWEGGRAGV